MSHTQQDQAKLLARVRQELEAVLKESDTP